ncbi:hypothetical protein E7Z59_02290 [Robertkochia marina]|uniref:Uncharacterized protein n=1 Tax=Robertkochia marina TaxID=1227945 RepID=A0A4S3M2T0_9FLAO|nr:hypothetical protein [Robertkochia marina]THD69180.1 hypothetical protein E7Z59_02290 [Robertkochia marina]TRZ47561.1 hypothetical protein D3A96_02310 [Robertkochia marina]
MKRMIFSFLALIFTLGCFSQVAYFQYRKVPADREAEFVEKETKYWSKVAKDAIDKGLMTGWSLWRKVGVTNEDAPNYVFVNSFASLDKMNLNEVWEEDNLTTVLGVDPSSVETNSFTTIPFDYWLQLEAAIPGEYDYALVNYAMPEDRAAFIEENKTLWQPFHQSNIDNGESGMKSWGMMSVIYPSGSEARFSVMTWDGFETMKDALNYLRFTPQGEVDSGWSEIMNKTKMGEILPDGFVWSIMYERVMSVGPEPEGE